MKRWQIITVVIVLILATAFFFLFMYQGSSKSIEAVADQFKPDSSWQLVDDKVVPPTFMCLEANCPSVHRSWKTGRLLTKDEFRNILRNSGWDFAIQGDCLPNPRVSGSPGAVCGAEGVRDEYQVVVDVVGTYGDDTVSKVVLRIERNH